LPWASRFSTNIRLLRASISFFLPLNFAGKGFFCDAAYLPHVSRFQKYLAGDGYRGGSGAVVRDDREADRGREQGAICRLMLEISIPLRL
jgi:hypothetical protein